MKGTDKSNEFQNYIKIKTRSQVLTTENASEEGQVNYPIGNLRCETTDTLSSIRIEITSSSGRGKYWEVEDLEDRGETLARGFGGEEEGEDEDEDVEERLWKNLFRFCVIN